MNEITPVKPDFTSKTWWFNLGTVALNAVLAAVAAYMFGGNLQVVGDPLPPVAGFGLLPALLTFAPSLVALVNLVLRYATDTPIRPFWER